MAGGTGRKGLIASSMTVAILIIVASSPLCIGGTASLDESERGAHGVLLDERFDSWGEIDPRWTFWNCSHGDFRNWFDVTDGQLHASNNGVMEPTNYLSYANWTETVAYEGEFRLSFDIYLPLAYTDKIGWAGQVFWIQLFDQFGDYGLISRFVMDATGANPSPNGFVYWDSEGIIRQICTFDAGWHQVSYILRNDSTTWAVAFDGVLYDGLEYSSPQTGPFEISRLSLINALREEVQNIYLDNVVIEVFNKGYGTHRYGL